MCATAGRGVDLAKVYDWNVSVSNRRCRRVPFFPSDVRALSSKVNKTKAADRVMLVVGNDKGVDWRRSEGGVAPQGATVLGWRGLEK